jgi:transglutaminase-like putative cysteine protease
VQRLSAPISLPLSTTPQERLALLEQVARDGSQSPRVERLAYISRTAHDQAATLLETMHREVPFVADAPDVERIQPVEYTMAFGGDCANLAAALVALYLAAGIRARLAWLDLQSQGYPYNHVAVQISYDPPSVPDALADWLWAEPSVKGARIGEHPLSAAARANDWRALGG